MEHDVAPRPARFRRKIVGILGLVPNSPTHRRDTIECKLECGHSRCILRVNRNGTATADQCRDLIGMELPCAKCFVTERVGRKTGERRPRRSTARATVQPVTVVSEPRG